MRHEKRLMDGIGGGEKHDMLHRYHHLFGGGSGEACRGEDDFLLMASDKLRHSGHGSQGSDFVDGPALFGFLLAFALIFERAVDKVNKADYRTEYPHAPFQRHCGMARERQAVANAQGFGQYLGIL